LVDIPVLSHLQIVGTLERHGFRVLRQGKHVVMAKSMTVVTIPFHNPVNRWTLAGIIKVADMTVDEFREVN
jgi:predicted RNA binding protein YcfA (HicA-like mRNA interferase family)